MPHWVPARWVPGPFEVNLPVVPAGTPSSCAEALSWLIRLARHSATPTDKMALIRRDDTFTVAPWTPALETYKVRMVIGTIGPTRITWLLDRGRGLARGIS